MSCPPPPSYTRPSTHVCVHLVTTSSAYRPTVTQQDPSTQPPLLPEPPEPPPRPCHATHVTTSASTQPNAHPADYPYTRKGAPLHLAPLSKYAVPFLSRKRGPNNHTHLSCDSHQGHAVHHSISQSSHQVGGSRTAGGNAHTHATCGLGITLSCKDLTLHSTECKRVQRLSADHQPCAACMGY
jgi:hypothetical protein